MIKAAFPILPFAALLLASSLLAQETPAANLGSPACGAPDTRFDVKTDREQHPAQPEPGKALLYFIQEDSNFAYVPKPTTRFAIDGKWAGATHKNSYFYVSLDPGVHHLCASWQTSEDSATTRNTAAAHFTAEANAVYYFDAKDSFPHGGLASLTLTPLDSDEGQLLTGKFEFSASQPKK
jgi:hypothetical protein